VFAELAQGMKLPRRDGVLLARTYLGRRPAGKPTAWQIEVQRLGGTEVLRAAKPLLPSGRTGRGAATRKAVIMTDSTAASAAPPSAAQPLFILAMDHRDSFESLTVAGVHPGIWKLEGYEIAAAAQLIRAAVACPPG
jgi:hypothetical protein